MSGARERILGRVRAALGEPRAEPQAIAAEAADLVPDPAVTQPAFPQESNAERFIERATSERLTATVDEVAAFDEVPGAVGRYLERSGIGAEIALVEAPALTGLDWRALRPKHTIEPDETVSVALADWAVAETGTLVFHAAPETPTLFNFLALHHVVVVERARILRYMEEVWPLARAGGAMQARLVSLVTGTSGTADIEAINIRGAHGPRYMHIVIVGEKPEG